MKKLLPLLLVFMLSFSSCLKDKATPVLTGACGTTISYTADIKPIINTSCVTNLGPGTGCHDAWIFQYDQVVATINNGTLENRVFSVRDMPLIPNDFGIDSLTSDEITTFQCWIDQGFPEN